MAANAQERAKLEQDWANYNRQTSHLDKLDQSASVAAKARAQKAQREQQGNAEIEAIKRRVERQEKGKSTWQGMAEE
jgi:hypothetical protein